MLTVDDSTLLYILRLEGQRRVVLRGLCALLSPAYFSNGFLRGNSSTGGRYALSPVGHFFINSHFLGFCLKGCLSSSAQHIIYSSQEGGRTRILNHRYRSPIEGQKSSDMMFCNKKQIGVAA